MEERDGRKAEVFEFQLTRLELLEFSVRAYSRLLWMQKIFLVVVGGFFLVFLVDQIVIGAVTGEFEGFLSAMTFGIFIILILFVTLNFMVYRRYVKLGYLKPRSYRIEDGYIFCRKDNSKASCSNYSCRMQTPHVIILERSITKANIEVIPFPKRIFNSMDDREAFLEYFRNPVPVQDNEHAGGGRFDLYYVLDKGAWLRVYTEMVQAAAFMRSPAIKRPRIFSKRYPVVNEATYRKLLDQDRLSTDGMGIWELACMDEMIRLKRPYKMADCRWEDYCHLIETEDTIFLIHMNEIKIAEMIPIPKWVFDSQEEMAAFLAFCKTRGVEREEADIRIQAADNHKNRYLLYRGIILAVCLVCVGFGLLDSMKARRNIEENPIYRAAAQSTELFRFNPDDYPDYVPVEVQAEVLRSLGIDGLDDDIVKRNQDWMNEYPEARVYVEGYPYYTILSDIGAGTYDDETGEWVPTSGDVYWFDFEGWDISQDYIDIIEGIQMIAGDDVVLSDIRENVENVDWDNGTGEIGVFFTMDGKPYHYQAEMKYDWIDAGLIGFFNQALEECGKEKRLYCTEDNGQGAILFYNTEEWARQFESETGISLQTAFE